VAGGMYRQSLAAHLTTTAPDSEALKWKRSKFKQGMDKGSGCYLLPISENRIRAATGRDEKFLAAHPGRRKSARELAREQS
jgi:hypothetical protein